MRDLHGPASASARFRLLFPSPVTEGVVLGFDFGTRRIGVAIGAMALLLVWRHRANISRLLAGKESRIGSKKKG